MVWCLPSNCLMPAFVSFGSCSLKTSNLARTGRIAHILFVLGTCRLAGQLARPARGGTDSLILPATNVAGNKTKWNKYHSLDDIKHNSHFFMLRC
jgi:hypothetical protein